MPKVGLSTGDERRELLRKAAYYIRSETAKQITSRPVIMPRSAPPGSEIKRTRGEAIRGLLEELVNFHDREIKYFSFEEIIICGNPDEIQGLDALQASERMRKLPIRVENLYANGPWDRIEVQDVDGDSREIRVNRRIKKSKFRISLSIPSSDPAFGVFGSLQNMIFAVHPADRPLLQGVPEEVRLQEDRASSVASSPLIPDAVREESGQPQQYQSAHKTLRKAVSGSRETETDTRLQYRTLYRNLAHLAEHVMPDLAYVDGTFVVGGTGDSPIEVKDGGFALSGDDPVAVDTVLARILGMDVASLGHLQYLQQRHMGCADEDDIKVAVGNPDDLDIDFTPHPDEERRLGWHHVRLPGENGEAVGYIPPGDEEEEEESEKQEETAEEQLSEKAEEEDETGAVDETTSETATEETESEPGTEEEQAQETETEEPAEEKETEEQETVKEEASREYEGDTVRERVRKRLIDRGKLEGEGTTQTDTEPETEAEEKTETPEDTEREAEEEEQTEEATTDTEEETEEEGKEEKAAEAVVGDEEDLGVRERVRRRLIRRGKLEGELPDEEVEGVAEEKDEEEREEEEETDVSEREEEETEKEPDEGAAEEEPEEAAEGEKEDQPEEAAEPDEASSPTQQEDLDLRERVERRLIRRGKLEGELPEEEIQEAEVKTEAEETQAEETPGKEEQEESPEADTVDGESEIAQESVDITSASGPSLEPAEDVSDPEQFLSSLSGFEAEDKIRGRLAIRKRAVEGAESGDGKAASTTPAEEGPEDSKDQQEEDSGAEGKEQDEMPSGEAEEEEAGASREEGGGEEGGGYVRDPDAPLRERVKERLTQRGKLEK